MAYCEILYWSTDSGGTAVDAFIAVEDAVSGLNEFPCDAKPWSARVAALQSTTGMDQMESDLIQAPRRTKDDLYEFSIMNEPDSTVLVLPSERKVLQAETSMRAILDNCLKLKTRASLHLEGREYANSSTKVLVLRLTKHPSNQYQGIVVGIVHQVPADNASAEETGDAKYVDRLLTLFREASEARVPGSACVRMSQDTRREYQLQGTVEEEKQYLAVQLLQLFNIH